MLRVETGWIDRIVVVQETADEYIPLFEIYYMDKADALTPLLAGREAAIAFAHALVARYNNAY